MKVSQNKFVSVSYTLSVDGAQVETTSADAPLQFIFGAGFMLPAFEQNLEGLSEGDKFAFTILAADGYGDYDPQKIQEVPKDLFYREDGTIEEGLLELGNQFMVQTPQGPTVVTVKAVTDQSVTLDMNMPMAGKNLDFTGSVVGVREATDEDYMQGMMAAGGCGCGENGCGDDSSGCGSSGCGCGC